jgi:hypothetical protein
MPEDGPGGDQTTLDRTIGVLPLADTARATSDDPTELSTL